MKKLVPLLMLMLLTACNKATVEYSIPEEHYKIPLSEYAENCVAPSFLSDNQQQTYREAVSLYNAMFGGDTLGICNDEIFADNSLAETGHLFRFGHI